MPLVRAQGVGQRHPNLALHLPGRAVSSLLPFGTPAGRAARDELRRGMLRLGQAAHRQGLGYYEDTSTGERPASGRQSRGTWPSWICRVTRGRSCRSESSRSTGASVATSSISKSTQAPCPRFVSAPDSTGFVPLMLCASRSARGWRWPESCTLPDVPVLVYVGACGRISCPRGRTYFFCA